MRNLHNQKAHNSLTIAFAVVFSITASTAVAAVGPEGDLNSRLNGLSKLEQKIPKTTILELTNPALPAIIIAMGSSNTSKITGTINRGARECGSVPAEYQADCLAQTFGTASRTANGMVDYTTAGKELGSAKQKIDAVVSQNLDNSAPTLKKGRKTLRAVKKSAVATVQKQTKAIIAETETKLLRSAGNSKKRKTHFGRIAKAVGSTKTILRSA